MCVTVFNLTSQYLSHKISKEECDLARKRMDNHLKMSKGLCVISWEECLVFWIVYKNMLGGSNIPAIIIIEKLNMAKRDINGCQVNRVKYELT